MRSVFTEYVRALEAGGDPPTAEEFDRLWAELRRVLTSELKRRHLWSSPPSYFGIYGFQTWTEGSRSTALEDLAGDCYVFVFLDRLRNLKAHAASKPDVEGLVTLYVRHFLYAAQRKQDPLGFKVFDVLRSALRRLLDEDSLHVLKGPKNVRNDTIFGFSSGEDPRHVRNPFDDSDVTPWSDAVLPAVLSSRGEAPAEAVDQLAARISELPTRDVRVFRFRDIIDPLKADVRSRWGQILEDLRGETAAEFEEDELGRRIVRFISMTQPDTDFEERDRFDALVDCVDRELRRLDLRARTRDYLEKLWGFLQGYAVDVESEAVPSHRKLSDLLDIPRERLPELYELLGELLEQCRVDVSSPMGDRGAAPVEGVRSMDGRTRHEELRARTGEALARLAPEPGRTGTPRPGDLYVLEPAGGLEWAVLFRAAGRCLLVPADTFPLTGSDDVAVVRGAAAGPLNLRCAFAVWVDTKRLEGAARGGRVDMDVVERARARLAESEDGTASALPAQREVDRDPEYEDWTRDVLAAGRDALVDVRPRTRTRRAPIVVSCSLAAALLAALVGLAVLRQQLDVLSQPTVDVSRHEIIFKEQPRGNVLEVDPDSTHILLGLLLLRGVESHEGYVVEIVDEGGEIVWRRGVLEPKSQYHLLVPCSRLPAGLYVLRLYGVTEGDEVLVDEQERQVEYRAEP